MNFQFLIEHLYKAIPITEGKSIPKEADNYFTDLNYLYFIDIYCNGGFFFDKSLVLYSHGGSDNYCQIYYVNGLLSREYGHLFDGLISFGQDLFGNQFCFEKGSTKISFFEIEVAEKKTIANSFEEWETLLKKEWEYYSAYPYLERWLKFNTLNDNERICPKKPFVIGGDYENSNFYALEFPKFISYNSSIAKQLQNVPDGTKVVLKIIPPNF